MHDDVSQACPSCTPLPTQLWRLCRFRTRYSPISLRSTGSYSRTISELLQNEKNFHDDLKDLGNAMCTLLSCLTDVRYAARIAPAKESVLEILKAVLEAASFVDGYLKKNRLGE
jgi:hypothetical protein